jgi:hypothetical protein
LPAVLIGGAEVIYPNWDKKSVRQLNKTANIWQDFERGLNVSLGENESQPKLEHAAKYVVAHGEVIQKSSNNLDDSLKFFYQEFKSFAHFDTVIIAALESALPKILESYKNHKHT